MIRTRASMIKSAQASQGRTLTQEAWIRFKRNKLAMCGLVVLLVLLIISIGTIIVDIATANQFFNEHVVQQNLRMRLQEPSTEHIFGLDEFGRSMFYRMLWGARYSIFIGLSAVAISAVVGGFIGSISGFYGNRLDNLLMRLMDVLLAIPSIILAMAIIAALGTSMFNLLISISIPTIPGFARIVRASVMSVKDREFVEAARCVGADNKLLIFKYILPNAIAPVIVHATLGIAGAILTIAGLSYLGLGIQPPTPEWGAMLSSARIYLRDAWHITVIPGLGITITILALNVFGDGLRDALDPRLKR